ncbi:MAG: hypothetical protein K2X02_00115 [Alphaproteobacteria bacterium]|nr:hypothetical protein [Alphaproteobacteria bacterium]
MEKKTLTSLAMITFLMTSTAVVAMGDDPTDPNPLAGPPVKIEAADKDNQPHATPSVATKAASGQSNGHWFWGWFSRSTPPVEEGSKEGAPTLPSTFAEESSTSVATVKTAIQLDTSLNMEEFNPYLTSGFSAFEGTHRWTAGDNAIITLPLEEMEPRPSRVSFFNTKGLVTASHSQNLIVNVNGEEAGSYVYTLGNNNQTIEISLPEAGPAEIKFTIPHAKSPFELGINADQRVLGISFREAQFQTPTPPTELEFVTQSVNLDRAQLQRLLQLAQSPDTGKLEEVGDIFSSPTTSTASSEATPQTLTTEERGLLSNLYHMIFG